MPLKIKTNLMAMQANRRLQESSQDLMKSMERLSSGRRINRSSDNAAGLAVSERIRSSVKGLGVARNNAADAISYIQTSEGALNEITNIIIRMRELTSQSASDTIGNRERSFLNKEFQQLRSEVKRIVEATEFNGTKTLSGESFEEPLQIFVGASNRGQDIEGNAPDYSDYDPDILKIDFSSLESLTEGLEGLLDEEIAIVPDSVSGGATELGPDGTDDLMSRMDTAVNAIASYRAVLGSVQSRLNSTIANIDVSSENLSAARSRIVDVDYAQEMANFTKSRILNQAGLSVQAHANAIPEMVFTLLK